MHECPECGKTCDCDGEDTWRDDYYECECGCWRDEDDDEDEFYDEDE